MNHDADSNPSSDRNQRILVDAAWKQIELARRGLTRATVATAAADPPAMLHRANVLADGLPGYRIVREIHRGGQGVVYEAIQESTNRTVAIKMMRTGPFAGPHDRLRFEREVQILARLRHPNIVTVHDSGSFEDAAYFVMDYVEGQHLDHYVRDHDLNMDDRLRLFARVCNAVHVAHLRGVIHRDLKPSNIRIDNDGEPHVLDFGLAKHEELDRPAGAIGDTITQTGQFVGSLPWASPEQADGRHDELDVRTDVYSLGVMLYQLLTGQFPYDVSGSIRQTADAIAHAEPKRPQTLNREVDDELATIVLKALQKEPPLRYQTAGELGRDVERYLRGEAIEAKRDSATYILRKQLARHKGTAGIVFAFLMLVTFGFVVTLSLWRQTESARRAEADQRKIAESNAALADTRAAEAASEAAKAEAVTKFLTEMLGSASPLSGIGADVTVRQAIDAAVERLDRGDFADQPDVQAAVRRVIGATYASLGLYPEGEANLAPACEQLANAADVEPREALGCQIELAALLRTMGEKDRAETLFRKTLDRARSTLSENDVLVAECLNGLGRIARDADKLDEAQRLNREALALLEDRDDAIEARAETYNELSLAQYEDGDVDGAIETAETSLKLYEQKFGRRHHKTAVAMSNLADHLAAASKFAEAEALNQEALGVFKAVDGERHPVVASCLDSLGRLHTRRGNYKVAVEYLEESLDIRREALGPRHTLVANALNNLAVLKYQLGDLDGAADAFRGALDIFRETHGPNHPSVAKIMGNLAAVLVQKGDLEAAAEIIRDGLARTREAFGDRHERTAQQQHNLGKVLLDLGKLDEAETLLREALDVRIEIYGEKNAEVSATQDMLAGVLRKKKEYDEAEYLCQTALDTRRELLGDGHITIANSLNNLAGLYSVRGAYDKAEPLLAEAVVIAEKNLPADHWNIAQIRGNWGAALAKLQRYDAAEPILLGSYERMYAVCGERDPRTVTLAKNLVQLYESWGRPEQADPWRKVAAQRPPDSQPASD